MDKDSKRSEPNQTNYMALGLSLGLLFGSAVGIVLGIAMDNMAFMAIFTGGGLTLGVALGSGLEQLNRKD
ncbi:MAG: hypothetical protein H6667_10335 [Ardenticatenaceae bacterium]|nr:hypothetical protein [Ardenticatenaceae bacterium]MCB9446414.1 hypothetical protein [Ardenticatenaceae bacterium]